MFKKTQETKTVAFEEIQSLLSPPEGVWGYVERYITETKGLTVNAAAKEIGIDQSTLSRFLNGGTLTENLASKLFSTWEVDPEILFNLDAKYRAYKAKKLAQVA